MYFSLCFYINFISLNLLFIVYVNFVLFVLFVYYICLYYIYINDIIKPFVNLPRVPLS